MEVELNMTIETYDLIAQSYVETTCSMRPQPEFEAFCRTVTSGGVVLDAGCAWGRDCRAFVEQGFLVIGVDLSQKLLELAREFAPSCSFIQADLRYLPLANGCIDGIWCCNTLLHLKRSEIINALLEFGRVLRAGASCYLQVKKGVGEEIVGQSFSQGYLRFFTYFNADEMSDFCEQAGFAVLEWHMYNEKDRPGSNSRDQELLCFLIRKN